MNASDQHIPVHVSPTSQTESITKPWLSILIPVYNVERYVRACVESVMAQNLNADVEVLLLNDASTDSSALICRELVEKFPSQLELLEHDRNRGLSAARNTLLENASGQYVWFIDSDDTILPNALKQLHSIVDLHAPDIVLCDYRRRRRIVSSFIGPSFEVRDGDDELTRGLFASGRMHIWSKITRRSLWGNDLRFPEGRYYEDILTTPRLFRRARDYFHIASPWVEYRLRKDSITAMGLRFQRNLKNQNLEELAAAVREGSLQWNHWTHSASGDTRFWIAAFCAKKYCSIAGKLLWASLLNWHWGQTATELRHFRSILEGASPVPFIQIVLPLLQRRQFKRGLVLLALLSISESTVRNSHPTGPTQNSV